MNTTINPETDILAIIDLQYDFMPGGLLAVPRGDELVKDVNRLLEAFRFACMSQDWHPRTHSSFAANHEGAAEFTETEMPYGMQTLWPVHCVQSTPGADVHDDLDQSKVVITVRKGMRPEIDAYSAFFENDRVTPTGLAEALRGRGVENIYFCGLTRPFCIDYSAEDAAVLGFGSYVIEDVCGRLGPDAQMDESKARLTGKGVKFTRSDLILSDRPGFRPG